MIKKKKKSVTIEPQYIKNSKGKTTHVYLPYKTFEYIEDQLKQYDKVKKKGIRWIQVSREKSPNSKSKKLKK